MFDWNESVSHQFPDIFRILQQGKDPVELAVLSKDDFDPKIRFKGNHFKLFERFSLAMKTKDDFHR